MAKPGHPTKYNAKFHPQIAFWLAQAGLTNSQMATELDIAESTLDNWKNKYPLFLGSIKGGKLTPDDEVEAALLKRAKGFEYSEIGAHGSLTKQALPEVAAMIFWLKNRRPGRWRDKQELDVNMLNSPAWLEIQQALILVLQAHPEALEDTKKVLAKFAGKGE